MTWIGLLLLVLCAWLAFKLVGALLKLLMFVLALVGAYWFLAPHFGWPTVSELFHVFGPDFDGRRIEELADPAEIARRATDHVVDNIAGRVGELLPGQADAPAEPLPEPLPEDAAEEAAAAAEAQPTR
jgi:hypothetical protein